MSVRVILTVVFCSLLAGAAHAGLEETQLQGGSYEVRFRLELPHVENWAADKVSTICVGSDAGFPVLSGNNPLAKCPARNIRRNGATLQFDILCEGRDAARARAVYILKPREFKGRIAMIMGGKNMTMVEVQTGRRVGSCDLASRPPF